MKDEISPQECPKCGVFPRILRDTENTEDGKEVKLVRFECPECGISSESFCIYDSDINIDMYITFFKMVKSWAGIRQ